jgi:hypothetical protein
MSRLKRQSVTALSTSTSQIVDTRRKSMSSAIKEKNVIVILAIIAIVFAACNIPMAVARIMIGPGYTFDVAFQVCDVSACDVSVCDAAICDVAICDVAICDIAICDVANYDAAICDAAVCDNLVSDISVCAFCLYNFQLNK